MMIPVFSDSTSFMLAHHRHLHGCRRTLCYPLRAGRMAANLSFQEGSHADKFIPVTIKRGLWYHIAVTLDKDGTVKTFFNGNLIDTDVRQAPINVTGILNIGRAPYGAYYLEALIDEVRIWNVARTQEQIQANMNHPIENPESLPNLVGYWNFDNGTADLSQYGNDGILKGDARVANVIHISPNGNDTTGDGTVENPYRTIRGYSFKKAENRQRLR